MKSLNDLVAQAESIATNLEDDEIPHIQRSIDQLRQRGGQFSYTRGAQNDIKAAKLLGNKVGFELSAGLSKTIESLQILSTYDGSTELNVVDIPGFLKNARETAILSSINMTRNNTSTESYKRSEVARSEWWREEKNKILGLLSSGDKLCHVIDTCVSQAVVRSAAEVQVSGRLGRDEKNYARQVAIFVDNSVCQASLRQSSPLCDLVLSDESSPMKTSKCVEMSELARLISRYCNLSPTAQLADQRQSEGNLSRQMVHIAIEHLEAELLRYIRQCVDAISMAPSQSLKYSLVTFLTTQMLPQLGGNDGACFEDGNVNGVPVWPLIYLCLRTGQAQEAAQVAKEATNNIGDWHCWLEEYVNEGRVSNDHTRMIVTDYKRYVRGTNDHCKRLVYCLVGGCDTEDNHPHVLQSVDDFMWARLSHLRRSYCGQDNLSVSLNRSRQSAEHQSLLHIQRLVSEEYGESHFQAQQQPATYCKVLLLCQLLEPAVAFLARFDHLRCHGVHAALSLWHQGLLLVPEDIRSPLLSRLDHDPHGITRLNLARLVTLYTRQFESAHPKETLDLFYLLCDVPTVDSVSVFVSLASSLVLGDSANMYLLLGPGGGLVARYGGIGCGGSDVRESVLDVVVTRLMEAGRGECACDALLLAGRYSQAGSILANILASCLATRTDGAGGHGDSQLARLQHKAQSLLQSMSSTAATDTTFVSLSRVLDIASFVSLATQSPDNLDAALLALDRTRLLPSSSEAGRIRSSLESFRSLPELVRSLVPVILVTAMRIIRLAAINHRATRYSAAMPLPSACSGTAATATADSMMCDIRQRAAALITFTGQLPYRMPSDVYASVSQLELDVN